MGSRNRILVVDDEELVCKAMGDYFVRHGYEVVTAFSGEDALMLLKAEEISLAIIDLVMPRMDGMELLMELQKRQPPLPTIICTGAGFDEGIMAEARANGAAGFLSKGLPFSSLLLEVHRILNYPAGS
jgi:DNA-binding NtrC family response regulator